MTLTPKEQLENMTPEEVEKAWKDLFQHFANPNCKGCYGRGWIGVNVNTGKVEPCYKKSCAYQNLKRQAIIEKQNKAQEEKLKKEENENKKKDK